MAFTTNNDRHAYPHRINTGYNYNGKLIGPSEISFSHKDGSILTTDFEDGVVQTRRKRREIRIITLNYDFLEFVEWKALWDFYNLKAEHELYHFFINLYYMDTLYPNEWIGVNYTQKMDMRNFDVVFGSTGLRFMENLQATATHVNPA